MPPPGRFVAADANTTYRPFADIEALTLSSPSAGSPLLALETRIVRLTERSLTQTSALSGSAPGSPVPEP